EAMRYPEIADRRLMVDLEELRKLDCRYIFSRIELDNAEELGLKTVGTWAGAGANSAEGDPSVIVTDADSPYTITVYEIPDWTGRTARSERGT
ncbi:MAG: DUF6044 family protein, partial [Lachnospiraceae bacterium]|nr:DUF6044 family protein [Lachnospiraceae bacterium]